MSDDKIEKLASYLYENPLSREVGERILIEGDVRFGHVMIFVEDSNAYTGKRSNPCVIKTATKVLKELREYEAISLVFKSDVNGCVYRAKKTFREALDVDVKAKQ